MQYTLGKNEKVGFLLPDGYDSSLPLVIDPELSASTYLGGNKTDEGNAILTDADGNIYVAGATASANFPIANPSRRTCPAWTVL